MPNGLKVLCDAALRGDLELVKRTVDEKPDLMFQKHEGATPLHFAALEGQNAVVEFFIKRGADLNVPDDEFGGPPAGWANEKGHASTVELLESHGIRMSAGQAAAWGLQRRLEDLLESDPEAINAEDGFGTPLHEAVIWGRTGIVTCLLDRGANAQLRSRDGKTALELALAQAKNGRTHTPIVTEGRRAEIERQCARIARILSQGDPR